MKFEFHNLWSNTVEDDLYKVEFFSIEKADGHFAITILNFGFVLRWEY